MDAGGENFEASGVNFTVTTEPQDLGSVRDALDGYGAKVLSAELTLVPRTRFRSTPNPRRRDSSPDGRH